MQGMEEGSGTRSSLLWEVKRLLTECDELPQILLMENVPQVHSKANKKSFDDWCSFLMDLGYSNHWEDLNAKNYGVAQSRNRTFMVSILGDYDYEFPKPFPLELRLKDYLEDSVDEKYYLTSDKARELIDKLVLNGKITLPQREREREKVATCHTLTQKQRTSALASKQDTMVASTDQRTSEPELLKHYGTQMVKQNVDVASCVQARDCKGFGNQEQTGVIECKKITT